VRPDGHQAAPFCCLPCYVIFNWQDDNSRGLLK
jgi:hypothetical protein